MNRCQSIGVNDNNGKTFEGGADSLPYGEASAAMELAQG